MAVAEVLRSLTTVAAVAAALEDTKETAVMLEQATAE